MRTPDPSPTSPQLNPPMLWLLWSSIAAGLLVPLGLSLSPLPLPHPATPPLAPETLASAAYALGIALAAAALLLRQRWNSKGVAVLASAALAEAVAWTGFAAWLIDPRTPAFYTLLIVAALVLWLVRPARETRQ